MAGDPSARPAATIQGWLLYSSLGVSVCATALTAGTFLLAAQSGESVIARAGRSHTAGATFGWDAFAGLATHRTIVVGYLLFVFAATYATYTADRLLVAWSPEDAYNRPTAMSWQSTRRRLLAGLSIACALVALGALGFIRATLSDAAWPALALGAILSLAYCIPLGRLGRLQDAGGLKPIAAALIWMLGTTAVPLLSLGTSSELLVIACSGCFVLLLANAILCDILDHVGDAAAFRKTLAVRLGPVRARRLCTLLLLGGCISLGIYAAAAAPGSAWRLSFLAYGLPMAGLILLTARDPATIGDRGRTLLRHSYDGVLTLPALVLALHLWW